MGAILMPFFADPVVVYGHMFKRYTSCIKFFLETGK